MKSLKREWESGNGRRADGAAPVRAAPGADPDRAVAEASRVPFPVSRAWSRHA